MAAQDVVGAAAIADPTAGQWLRQRLDHAIANRQNLVYDSTLSNPDLAKQFCERLQKAGYETEVAYVAVTPATSSLGNASRYLDMLDKDGWGRIAPETEALRKGVPETAHAIEANGLADKVSVYPRGSDPRGADPLYTNQYDKGTKTWAQPIGAREAIEAERGRKWSPQETANFVQRLNELKEHPLRAALPEGMISAIERDGRQVADPTVMPPEAEPASWRDRPHGALNEGHLNTELESARRSAETAVREANEYTRSASADLATAEAGRGERAKEVERQAAGPDREAQLQAAIDADIADIKQGREVPTRQMREAASREASRLEALQAERDVRDRQAESIGPRSRPTARQPNAKPLNARHPNATPPSATRRSAIRPSPTPPSPTPPSATPPSPMRPTAMRRSAMRPSAMRPSAMGPTATPPRAGQLNASPANTSPAECRTPPNSSGRRAAPQQSTQDDGGSAERPPGGRAGPARAAERTAAGGKRPTGKLPSKASPGRRARHSPPRDARQAD